MGEKNNYGCNWKIFKSIVERSGFKVAYQHNFTDITLRSSIGLAPSIEKEVIYYNSIGIIIYAYSSSNKETIGNADCYLEVQPAELVLTDEEIKALHCFCKANYDTENLGDYNVLPVNFDVKEDFISRLEKILSIFKISKIWNVEVWKKTLTSLYFLNQEEQLKEHDYEQITRQKIEACVPEARKIIYG